jgi:uncharacterized membrane protein YdbT with pleckstrin-like domain
MSSYLKNLLGENEQILFVAHQHWLMLLAKMIPAIILVVALSTFMALVWWFFIPNALVFLGLLLLIFPLINMLYTSVVWRNRKFIVTNKRVIQIFGVFNKDVTDSSLEKVNDVKLEQSVWGRVFDYGDIEILTASELGLNKFTHVGQPILLKTTMLNAKDKLEQGPRVNLPPQDATVALMVQLDSLRKHGILTEEEFQAKKAKLLEEI